MGPPVITDPVATLVNVLRFTLQVASIPRLITYMWQTDADLQLFGIKHLRQILYLEPCPVEEIISSEIVPRFVEFLHLNDHQELQFEAVSCFAIISSERPKVIDLYNILPVLVSLVSSPCAKISNEAIYTLGNVAGNHLNWNCSGAFDAVVARLNALLGQEEPFMLKVCSWTLANFCKGVLTSDQRAEAITTFKQLLNKQDYVVVTFACWAVSDISNGQVHSLIENGIGSQLADLLKNNYRNYTPSVLIPMLLTLLNILKEDDSEFQTSPKIMSDILMYVFSHNDHKGLHNIIYKIISDLAVTSEILIQCMLDSKIIDALLYYLDLVAKRNERNTADRNAVKVPKKVFVIKVDEIKEGEDDETDEAALALAHLTSNVRLDLARELVERGCIKQLCYLLSKKNPRQHPRVVAACLDGILNMLNVAESFDKAFVIEAFEDDYSSSIVDLAMEECNCVIVEGITTKATTIFNMLP